MWVKISGTGINIQYKSIRTAHIYVHAEFSFPGSALSKASGSRSSGDWLWDREREAETPGAAAGEKKKTKPGQERTGGQIGFRKDY